MWGQRSPIAAAASVLVIHLRSSMPRSIPHPERLVKSNAQYCTYVPVESATGAVKNERVTVMQPTSGRIGTPYGARGSYWSGGVHKGVDFVVPTGTTVVAPWSGVVMAVNWGQAFGTHLVIDFDRLPNGSPGLYGGLAHLSQKSVSPGQRIAAGQTVGRSGATGNVTGPHLHFEIQTSMHWVQGGHVNPQPWLDATPASSGVMKYGVMDSPAVKRLQEALNRTHGTRLPVSGNYLDQTDAAVRDCQRRHGFGHDPEHHSYVGPRQAAHLGL